MSTSDGSKAANLDDLKIWKPKKFKKSTGISKSDLNKLIIGEINEQGCIARSY